MTSVSYAETLVTSQVDGTTRSSFTSAVSIIPAAARFTLPPQFFAIGKRLRITAAGRISNVVTAQPTFAFTVLLGATGTTTVFDGGNMTCSTTAHTNVPWKLEIDLTCRAIGSSTSANLMGQGIVWSQAFVSGASADIATHGTLLIPNTAPAVGSGFDSTIANVVDLFAACSASNASNAITCHQYALEALN